MTRLRGIYMPYEQMTVGSPWPRSIQRLRDAGSSVLRQKLPPVFLAQDAS
jgi:hypothetical protein